MCEGCRRDSGSRGCCQGCCSCHPEPSSAGARDFSARAAATETPSSCPYRSRASAAQRSSFHSGASPSLPFTAQTRSFTHKHTRLNHINNPETHTGTEFIRRNKNNPHFGLDFWRHKRHREPNDSRRAASTLETKIRSDQQPTVNSLSTFLSYIPDRINIAILA